MLNKLLLYPLGNTIIKLLTILKCLLLKLLINNIIQNYLCLNEI